MNLYIAVPIAYAKWVIADGFLGRTVVWMEGDESEVCEFRDIPPTGLTLSRTAGVENEVTETNMKIASGGGPVLADDNWRRRPVDRRPRRRGEALRSARRPVTRVALPRREECSNLCCRSLHGRAPPSRD
jgi:hypothetical protein